MWSLINEGSANVFPLFKILNAVKAVFGYSKAGTHRFALVSEKDAETYSQNVGLGNLRLVVLATFKGSTVSNRVLRIVQSGIPSKILCAVVSFDSVVVTALHSFWTRAVKRFSNKKVDGLGFENLKAIRKTDNRVWLSGSGAFCHNLFGDCANQSWTVLAFPQHRLYAPKTADFVKTFVSNYIAPFFCLCHAAIVPEMAVKCG